MSIEFNSNSLNNFWNKLLKIHKNWISLPSTIHCLPTSSSDARSQTLKRNWTFHILTNWSTLMVMDSHRKIMETWALFLKVWFSTKVNLWRKFYHFIFSWPNISSMESVDYFRKISQIIFKIITYTISFLKTRISKQLLKDL